MSDRNSSDSSDSSDASDASDSLDSPDAHNPDVAEFTTFRNNWRNATGLTSQNERFLDSFGRRRYLKALYYVVGSRISKAYEAKESGELEGCDFTPFWTPVPGLCADLEISVTHLNRLLKEYCGLTAQQLCDRQRCFTMKLDEQLADAVARFIRARFVPGSFPRYGSELDLDAQYLTFWRAWREHRKANPAWDNALWASQYGFTSYSRFSKAFTMAYGKSPIEHESQTMREAALYFRAAHSLQRRFEYAIDVKRDNEVRPDDPNTRTYPPGPFSFDHYVQLRSENPTWWSRQRERYGLALELRALAKEVNKGEAQYKNDVLDDPYNVCTRESKLAESNPLPDTQKNNPWPEPEPDESSGIPPRLYPIGVGERSEQEAAPTPPHRELTLPEESDAIKNEEPPSNEAAHTASASASVSAPS